MIFVLKEFLIGEVDLMTIDPDTRLEHISPVGLEHQGQRKSQGGHFYSDVKMRHWIIKLHQEAFPELAEQMKNNPDSSAVYAAFLAIIPLESQGKMTDELRRKILKTFGLY